MLGGDLTEGKDASANNLPRLARVKKGNLEIGNGSYRKADKKKIESAENNIQFSFGLSS